MSTRDKLLQWLDLRWSWFAVLPLLAWALRNALGHLNHDYAGWALVENLAPLGVAVFIVTFESLRRPEESTKLRLLTGLLVLLPSVFAGQLLPPPHSVSLAGVLVGGGLLAWAVWSTRALETARYPMEDFLDGTQAYETHGVQVAVQLDRTVVHPRSAAMVLVLLQNAANAPREVRVTLQRLTRVALSATELRFSERNVLQLGAGEVGVFVLHVAPSPGCAGRYDLRLGVGAEGPRGARLRRPRATLAPPRSQGLMLAGALLSHKVDGGIAFQLKVDDSAPLNPPKFDDLRWYGGEQGEALLRFLVRGGPVPSWAPRSGALPPA